MTENEWGELAERVRALEQRLGDSSTPTPTPATPEDGSARPRDPDSPDPDPPDPDDLFWALEGLASRGSEAVLYAGVVSAPGQGPVRWQITRASADLLGAEWAEQAAAISALGHPVRLRILQLVLGWQASTAAELATAEGLGSTGQIYHHLRQLVGAGWLQATTRGHHVVPPERIVPLLTILSAAR